MVVDEPVEAQTVVDTVRGRRRAELRSIRVFDLYRGEQVGEGSKSLALRLEFRSPERTLTDEEVAGLRAQDQGGARARDGEVDACVSRRPGAARTCVVGASGYCRSARGGDPVAPSARLARGRDRAHATPAGGSTTSTRATACRSSSSPSTPSGWRRRPTSRSSATRTALRPRWSPSCAAAECGWSTCRPTSGSPTGRPTSAGTGRTARPSCVGEAVFGLTELHRDEIAAAAPGREPGLLLDRRDPGAGATCPRRA